MTVGTGQAVGRPRRARRPLASRRVEVEIPLCPSGGGGGGRCGRRARPRRASRGLGTVHTRWRAEGETKRRGCARRTPPRPHCFMGGAPRRRHGRGGPPLLCTRCPPGRRCCLRRRAALPTTHQPPRAPLERPRGGGWDRVPEISRAARWPHWREDDGGEERPAAASAAGAPPWPSLTRSPVRRPQRQEQRNAKREMHMRGMGTGKSDSRSGRV